MSWQKCPLCNGAGNNRMCGTEYSICSVCKGEKIISEVTGKPPRPAKTQVVSDWGASWAGLGMFKRKDKSNL